MSILLDEKAIQGAITKAVLNPKYREQKTPADENVFIGKVVAHAQAMAIMMDLKHIYAQPKDSKVANALGTYIDELEAGLKRLEGK